MREAQPFFIISSAVTKGKDLKRLTDKASGLRFLIVVELIICEALNSINGLFRLVPSW